MAELIVVETGSPSLLATAGGALLGRLGDQLAEAIGDQPVLDVEPGHQRSQPL